MWIMCVSRRYTDSSVYIGDHPWKFVESVAISIVQSPMSAVGDFPTERTDEHRSGYESYVFRAGMQILLSIIGDHP